MTIRFGTVVGTDDVKNVVTFEVTIQHNYEVEIRVEAVYPRRVLTSTLKPEL